MSKIVGPELPKYLSAKRKRSNDEEQPAPGVQQSASTTDTSLENGKQRRMLGPALPSGPAQSQSSLDVEGSSSSGDDDFGPAPPSRSDHTERISHLPQKDETSSARASATSSGTSSKPTREEWMLVPPKQDDWTSRVDPTKLKNRKFNTGVGAKAPKEKASEDNAVWTETPEQKQQRLKDEVMGMRQPNKESRSPDGQTRHHRDSSETAKHIRAYNEKHRGHSLYNEHKSVKPRDQDDDPSARAFDREKDIAGNRQIGHTQRKELLKKSANLGTKFSSGSYL